MNCQIDYIKKLERQIYSITINLRYYLKVWTYLGFIVISHGVVEHFGSASFIISIDNKHITFRTPLNTNSLFHHNVEISFGPPYQKHPICTDCSLTKFNYERGLHKAMQVSSAAQCTPLQLCGHSSPLLLRGWKFWYL